MRRWRLGIMTLGLLAVAGILGGCFRMSARLSDEKPVLEGTIFSVQYELEGGRSYGMTRANVSSGVPGGNGEWNVDLFGRLYSDFLLVTRPGDDKFGPLMIPMHRLISVQFGDGGIRKVAEKTAK